MWTSHPSEMAADMFEGHLRWVCDEECAEKVTPANTKLNRKTGGTVPDELFRRVRAPVLEGALPAAQKSNVKPILATRAASTDVGVSHAVLVGL
jgi:hypothetical protein